VADLARQSSDQSVIPEAVTVVSVSAGSVLVEAALSFDQAPTAQTFVQQMGCCVAAHMAQYPALLPLGAAQLMVREGICHQHVIAMSPECSLIVTGNVP
jgi:hypothetical protein